MAPCLRRTPAPELCLWGLPRFASLAGHPAVARAGLEALDYLGAGKPAPEPWVKDQVTLLSLAAKPHAELLLMIVPPVRKLVEAAQKGSW